MSGFSASDAIHGTTPGKTIFSGAVWLPEDRDNAQAMGWDIFDINSTGVLEVQAINGGSDEEARRKVYALAAVRNPTALAALAVIAANIIERQLGQEDDIACAISEHEAYYQQGNRAVPMPFDSVSYLTLLRTTI